MYITRGGGSRGNGGRVGELGQTFGYKPLSDFGPLGRNRALPSCHSSLYQQRDEEPSSLERGGGGRAQQQSERKEGVERRKQIKQTRGRFTVHPLREEGNCCERRKNYTLHCTKNILKMIPEENLLLKLESINLYKNFVTVVHSLYSTACTADAVIIFIQQRE